MVSCKSYFVICIVFLGGFPIFDLFLLYGCMMIRDRPFNLKGGYGYLFRSEFFFRTTQELEYLFFCRAKREIFSQNLTLGYMTKTLNQIFVFPPPKSEYFFQQHWNQNIFLEKKHNLPPPFQAKWSFPITSLSATIQKQMNVFNELFRYSFRGVLC